MKGKGTGKTIAMMVLICLVLVGAYFMLNQNEGNEDQKDKTNTEAQLLLQKDYDRNYPATVREVVNQYARITQCLYNEDISSEEFDGLVEKLRQLYDAELLEENPEPSYKESLEKEISTAKKNEYYMLYYQVQKLSSVKYWTSEEEEFASIIICITMNNGGKIEKTYEEFLLREDAKERWKIVGWRVTGAVEMTD